MRVMSYVRFPVNRRVKAGITEGDRIPAPPSLTADFELRPGPEKQDCFYECLACQASAGLSVFSRDCVAIPQDILDEMALHLEMCEGFK